MNIKLLVSALNKLTEEKPNYLKGFTLTQNGTFIFDTAPWIRCILFPTEMNSFTKEIKKWAVCTNIHKKNPFGEGYIWEFFELQLDLDSSDIQQVAMHQVRNATECFRECFRGGQI